MWIIGVPKDTPVVLGDHRTSFNLQMHGVAQAAYDPTTLAEALAIIDAVSWKKAIDSEHEPLNRHSTWLIEDVPTGVP